MSYLTLNGWPVPIPYGSGSHGGEEIGSRDRAYSGTLRKATRAFKRPWKFTTRMLQQSDAEFLEGMLRGDGWHFDFQSDLYAARRGAGPVAGYSGASISSTQKLSGNSYSLKITGGNSITFQTPVGAGQYPDYTIMFWHYYTEWQFCAILGDISAATVTRYIANVGNSWVPTSGSTILCWTLNGTTGVTLQGEQTSGAGADVYYGDLVVLPYLVPPSLLTTLAGGGTWVEFSDMPRLKMVGTLVKTTTAIEVLGKLNNATHKSSNISGTFCEKDRVIDFELHEV